ncbi:MAG TPA: hypothetical protein VMI54_07110 [Polyangiaceae bacterium]|nr:hypothetical protein [Polyangiaceae bacterium]
MSEPTNGAPPRRAGPIDVELWPSALSARVVEPGPVPRVHGYDVEADLARHYSFAEIALIALTGSAPERSHGRAFEIALAFLAPVPVSEAPAHAAGLARLIGADASGVISGAAMGLAERARHVVAAHAELVAWLDAGSGPPPPSVQSDDPEDASAVARLREALGEAGAAFPLLEASPTRMAALLGVLHGVGLTDAPRLEAALSLAALPATIAEAFAVKPFAFFTYPMDLPAFRYVEAADG